MAEVIYGEAERAIQRELVAMARVLEAERRRARKLLRRLQGLASYKAMEGAGDDEIGLHVAGNIAGSLEIAAGDLAENIRSLRKDAKATPERLAADAKEAQRKTVAFAEEDARRKDKWAAEAAELVRGPGYSIRERLLGVADALTKLTTADWRLAARNALALAGAEVFAVALLCPPEPARNVAKAKVPA